MECHITALDDVQLSWRQLDDGRIVATWADRIEITVTPSIGCTMCYDDVSAGTGTTTRVYQSQERPARSLPNQAIRRSQSRTRHVDTHRSRRAVRTAATQSRRRTGSSSGCPPVKRTKVCTKGKTREPAASTVIAVPHQSRIPNSDPEKVQTQDLSTIPRFTRVATHLHLRSASTMSCLRREIADWRSNKKEYWGVLRETTFVNWIAQGLEVRNSENGRLAQAVRLYHWFHQTRHSPQEYKCKILRPERTSQIG